MKHRVLLPLALILFSYGISGCSFLEQNTLGLFFDLNQEPSPPGSLQEKETESQDPALLETRPLGSATVSVEDLRPIKKKGGPSPIELLWEVPSTPSDAFLIRYGQDPESLDQEVRVETKNLERLRHEKFGTVYRYLLLDMPEDEATYVSLIAIRGEVHSPPSALLRVGTASPNTPKDSPGE